METELNKVSETVESRDRQMHVATLPYCPKSERVEQQEPFSPSDYKRAVCGAFLAAYLLTRSERLAEAAVCEAIESWHPDGDLSALQRLTTEASLNIRLRHPEQSNAAPAWIGPELRAVLELSQAPRDCFVMRILLGLPRETCSLLTRNDGPTVDRYTALATISLSVGNRAVANEVVEP